MSWDITQHVASCWIGDKKSRDKFKTWLMFIFECRCRCRCWFLSRCRCRDTNAEISKWPCKKGVLKNFAILTWKHLCWSLFAGLQVCNYIKKRLQRYCFPVNSAMFLRTHILKNTCEWLLLILWKWIETAED